MRLIRLLVAVALVVGVSSGAFAYPERAIELYRSRYGLMGRGVANPVDGSLWLAEGGMVTHSAADGTLLGRSSGLANPTALAVNPADGTCWVAQANSDVVVHLASDGRTICTVPGLEHAAQMVVNPQDGSVWVRGERGTPDSGIYLVRLSATGEVLLRQSGSYRIAAVDPNDGTAWRLHPDFATQTTEVVRLRLDGSEMWQVTLPSGGAGAEDTRDQSLWVMGARLATHLASDGTVLWQGTAPYSWMVLGLWASPLDDSVWVCYGLWGDGAPFPRLLHLSASGAVLLDTTGELLGHQDTDGSVWALSWDTSYKRYFEQISADGTILHRFVPPPLAPESSDLIYTPSAPVYSPADNSIWAIAALSGAGAGQAHYLVHFGPDGTVLNHSGTPWRYDALLGPTLNPADGSIWVGETDHVWTSTPTQDATVLLSPQGTELQRRTPGFGAGQGYDVWISPFDGSWWVTDYTTYLPKLRHLAPDGTELSEVASFTGWPVIDPADGSVWGTNTTYGSSWSATTTFGRLNASGQLVWTKTYHVATSFPVLEPDGSAWLIVSYASGAKREHFAPDGSYLGELPLTPELLSLQYAQLGPDGHLYGIFEEEGAGAGGGVRCLTDDGALVWELAGLAYTNRMALNPTDGSIWVSSGGVHVSATIQGAYVSHVSKEGTLLWQGSGFCCPWELVVDPRDGSVWVNDAHHYQIVHVRTTPSPFDDVDPSFWAYGAIKACYDAGVVTGYPDGTFRPQGVITRDLMAAYLARVRFGGDAYVPTGPAVASFSDVPLDYGFFRHIEYCVAAGIVQGYPDGGYRPLDPVTRGQMAAFLSRDLCGGEAHVPTGPGTASFSDVSPDFGFYKHIEYIASAGITTGFGDGTYHPEYACNRAQAAVFVARAFHLL